MTFFAQNCTACLNGDAISGLQPNSVVRWPLLVDTFHAFMMQRVHVTCFTSIVKKKW